MMQWAALWSLIATQVGTAIGIYKYFNARINKVYERLDNVKDNAKDNYVQKEMCKVMHDNNTSNLGGIETRINSRFERLEEKVESAFNMIIGLLKK